MESTSSIQNFKFPENINLESQCVFEIEKFRAYQDSERISSVKVEFFEFDITWWIQIYPCMSFNDNPTTRHSQFEVAIDIKSEEIRKSNKYKFQISVTSKDHQLFKTGFKSMGKACVLEKFRVQYDGMLQALTPNGSCVVIGKLEIMHLGEPLVRQISYSPIDTKKQIPKQLLNVLNDSTFSDFTFIVKGKEFKVHRAILASASEMMRNMFTTNLKELAEGQCKVDYIEPHIFDHLLRFIYAGEIPMNLSDISMELFKAAHYYGITNLMEICKQHILFKLNVDNAIEVCELASVYNMEDLRINAWNIVKNQILKIFFPLKNEPLSTEDLREIISIKENEKTFWLKHKKATEEITK